ncbi:EamA family transporter RarD [Gilliamella sp. B14384H2]|uniref:EamA family transporter RarD n=1 Tax=unclassified Gilliamella TaxID=2685620 RepID=UPI0018DE013A|nr:MULTISPECIES: EamA family transporter RarD [unclassified Gilliamella]MBI0037249.1 EamA family transporter RarD [Gilliamella sp. B14384G10]MBI0039098.1 EamA family transporter RarD [Gilliamella sp. B14384G7]MBI0051243.1 EamA family transporter RarD [Gilliamella sp. B14384G13]MBI0053536.1 EamA family transporter RarD [Gilliamella sp. B14384H2]
MIKGVALSILASCLFGLLYYYPVLLQPLSVVDIFCWRLLTSFPAIIVLILIEKQWSSISALFIRIKDKPYLLVGLLFSSFLLTIQMLIFIWAPINGHGLSASLGYFLLPLSMVVFGQIFYKERLSIFQKIAVLLASIGVISEIYITGAFSWETAIIALGYPIYFMTRRKLQIEGIAGTFSDFFFIFIGCLIYFLLHYPCNEIISDLSHFHIFIPMLGIITAIAFAMYFVARRLLPLGLFGLLGYVEPVLLTVVSVLFLHESISTEHILPYGLIWLSVCVLALEGTIYILRTVKRKRLK